MLKIASAAQKSCFQGGGVYRQRDETDTHGSVRPRVAARLTKTSTLRQCNEHPTIMSRDKCHVIQRVCLGCVPPLWADPWGLAKGPPGGGSPMTTTRIYTTPWGRPGRSRPKNQTAGKKPDSMSLPCTVKFATTFAIMGGEVIPGVHQIPLDAISCTDGGVWWEKSFDNAKPAESTFFLSFGFSSKDQIKHERW